PTKRKPPPARSAHRANAKPNADNDKRTEGEKRSRQAARSTTIRPSATRTRVGGRPRKGHSRGSRFGRRRVVNDMWHGPFGVPVSPTLPLIYNRAPAAGTRARTDSDWNLGTGPRQGQSEPRPSGSGDVPRAGVNQRP